jgi:lycopene cyclase domain-containing protein
MGIRQVLNLSINQDEMTYAQFLLYFLCPPIVLLSLATWRDLRNHRQPAEWLRNMPGWLAVCTHIVLAVAYTTPWDNYLVATGAWFYNNRLVTGLTIGWVPIEEYAFFVLQTTVTGLWLLWLSRRLPTQQSELNQPWRTRKTAVISVGIVWLLSLIGLFLAWQPFTYLGLILAWGLPPLILQAAFGADILWRSRRLIGLALGPVSVYLGVMDSLAIRAGTWTIDPAQSLNIFLGGALPVEEFVFFLITNLLITFGITLLLSRESRQRWKNLKTAGAQFRQRKREIEYTPVNQTSAFRSKLDS